MFLIISLVTLMYFVVGTAIARRDYARRVLAAGNRNVTEEIAAKKAELKGIPHTRNCWRGPKYKSKENDCDCNQYGRWNGLRREISQLESEGITVGGPWKMLFLWPVLSYDAFLKGGTIKPPKGVLPLLPKEWEEKMERELLDVDP